MNNQPDWDSYRSFLAVLEEGSLSGAARRLGLTQPTLGRHIESVEAALGQALFVRSQRGLTPTPAAEILRPYAEALQANAEALVRAASRRSDVVEGLVRITASQVVAAEVLPYILKEAFTRHPKLQLEVEGSDRTVDLLHRGADVAVRMADPVQQSLLATKAGDVEIGLYATPDYVARHGRIEGPEDAPRHTLIGPARQTPYVRALTAGLALPPMEAFAFRAGDDLTAISALRSGLGAGFCQADIARREGWIRMLPELRILLPAWVVMHEDLKANPACRAAFDLLAEGMRAYVRGQNEV
ncbi:MAG: LysR family transcriptional regulator [Caulobacteraceae bacterium]